MNTSVQTTKLKELPDETLVDLAKKGNTSAFEHLIKRHEDRIYSLIYRILNDKDETYDALQETVINAFQHLKNFRGKSTFLTWISRIAINCALMRKRAQKKYAISTDDGDNLPKYVDISNAEHITDWSSDPTLSMESKELKKVLNDSLQKIPEKYRNVIILKDLENRPIEEVAKTLNISVAATKSRLHRARMYLRWLLEQYVKQVYGTKYK